VPEVPWTLTRREFTLERVSEMKRDDHRRRHRARENESARPSGAVLDAVLHDHLVDELVVVNDDSSRRHRDRRRSPRRHASSTSTGPSGKGEAMSAGLAASHVGVRRLLRRRRRQHHRRLRGPSHPAPARARGNPTGEGLLRAAAAQHADRRRPGQRAGRATRSCRCSTPDSARSASPSPVRPRDGAAR
jgi:hypothetical protein